MYYCTAGSFARPSSMKKWEPTEADSRFPLPNLKWCGRGVASTLLKLLMQITCWPQTSGTEPFSRFWKSSLGSSPTKPCEAQPKPGPAHHYSRIWHSLSIFVSALLTNHEKRDIRKYKNLIYWAKAWLGFSTLPHTPWLWEGTEMSCDWKGGLKMVWRVGNKM